MDYSMKGRDIIQDLKSSILLDGFKVQVNDIRIISILRKDINQDIIYTASCMGRDIDTTDILSSKDTRIILGRLQYIGLSSLIQFTIDIYIRINMDQDIIDLQQEISRVLDLSLCHKVTQERDHHVHKQANLHKQLSMSIRIL